MKNLDHLFSSLLTISFAIVTLFCSMGICQTTPMEGDWVQVAKVQSGEQIVDSLSEATIENENFTIVEDGKTGELGRIVVDSSTSPKSYKLVMGGAGTSIDGIWSVSGETMLTCVSPNPNSVPPKSFSSTKDDGNVFIVWMRRGTFEKSIYKKIASRPKPIPDPTGFAGKAADYAFIYVRHKRQGLLPRDQISNINGKILGALSW